MASTHPGAGFSHRSTGDIVLGPGNIKTRQIEQRSYPRQRKSTTLHPRAAPAAESALGPGTDVSRRNSRCVYGIDDTLQDMHHHSPSYFSSSTWTNIPWTNIPKSEFDQFFDLFVRGPATFQAVDRLDGAEPLEKLRIALNIVHSCWELDADLAMFYEQFEKASLGPLYWPEFAKPIIHRRGRHDNYDDDNDDEDVLDNRSLFPISLHFPNLGTARTIILYWATLTMLWSGLYQLYGLIYALKETIIDAKLDNEREDEYERENHNTAPSTPELDSNTDDADAENLTFLITHLPPLDDHRRDFASMARNVCQSVEYCMQEEMLGLGPIILPAPLAIVIDTMKGYESFANEVRWARRVMRRISEGGLRILE
ncbi:hypothetical protein DTO271G3_7767 [Paecilomyces variotii]|nr:hypothetical protein DTO271G3_7767 [Paecilomyces variotii]